MDGVKEDAEDKNDLPTVVKSKSLGNKTEHKDLTNTTPIQKVRTSRKNVNYE